MLERTYIHCPGVGPRTERRLWEAGAATWADFVAAGDTLRLSARQRGALDPLVAESMARLAAGDHLWFARNLPPREHWRAWPAFRDRAAFLDIETTGSYETDHVTVVGLYDGVVLRQYVRDENLRDFIDALEDRAVLVTFFGTGFDLPFLRRAYGVEFPQLHVDLCFLLKRLGFSGGLKSVETQLGLARSADTQGLDGWDAVRLWWQWHNRADRQARDTLLAYNAEDVVNLATLMDVAYPMMLARTLGEDAHAAGDGQGRE